MFQAAGWILIITILSVSTELSLSTDIPTSPGMNIQIEGFKTEESCLKAGAKAKQDIKEQAIKHYAKLQRTEEREIFGAVIMPIAICVKKD